MMPRTALSAIAIATALTAPSVCAVAQELPPIKPAAQWAVPNPFAGDEDARKGLSGAACAPVSGSKRRCLAVNDEKRNAQFFFIEGTTITPAEVIRLRCEDGDPDAEGVAFGNGYFYVTGSHGFTRKNKPKPASFNVFRIAAEAATGEPKQPPSTTCAGVEQKGTLRPVLDANPKLKPFLDKLLSDDGISIEGIAVQGPRLIFGFRTPARDGIINLLSVDAASLFEGGSALIDSARLEEIALPQAGLGVRDLAAVSDGLLVLAGPKLSNENNYSIHLVRGGKVERSVRLDPAGIPTLRNKKGEDEPAKAETLLLLEETPTAYRVLLIFEGVFDGKPAEYEIPKPAT